MNAAGSRVLAIIKKTKDGPMTRAESAVPLDCSLPDYNRLDGYASIKEIAGEQRRLSRLFKLVDGGMNLPSLTMPIRAMPALDHFVAAELERFRAHTSLFPSHRRRKTT